MELIDQNDAGPMQHEWCLWLARSFYGIDWSLDGDGLAAAGYPPCTLRGLATAYVELYHDNPIGFGMTVEDWMDCIEAETGEWPAGKRG